MVLNSTGKIVDFFAWGYSAAEIQNMAPTINGSAVKVGQNWTGAGVSYTPSDVLSLQRIGNRDSNSANDFQWQAASKGIRNNGLATPFAASATPIPITPLQSGTFTRGTWAGRITVEQSATGMYLSAFDRGGNAAESNTFDVVVDLGAFDTIGSVNPASSGFYLRNSNNAGYSDYAFGFGAPGEGWLPVVGDWNGDGTDTVGMYDPVSSYFYLANSNTSCYADIVIGFGGGEKRFKPVAGDWDGDGIDTIGLYDTVTSLFYLRNTNTTGVADIAFPYGAPGAGWLPISGDWDRNGTDTVGLYSPSDSNFYLKNSFNDGMADVSRLMRRKIA
jgi:hypothetical protein